MAQVVLEKVNKVYPNGFQAIYDLDLTIEDKEFLVLVGPSGCGKSTALRMLAGLEEITSGDLLIGDRIVNDVHPKDRDIAMVFQNYALYPHKSVYDNIGFALKMAKVPKKEAAERIHKAAEILELTENLDRKPGQLSGGQRQRVAMGRAIVRQPSAFLMDEPLSNLDAKLRVQMRSEIARLQRDLAVTTVYVTHDQVEAMTMGTRVAVMKDGYLQQVDAPQDLYDRPVNVFVAAFIGSPSMNLYTAHLGDDHVMIGSHRFDLPASVFARRPALSGYVNQPVITGLRPEDADDVAVAAVFTTGDPWEATSKTRDIVRTSPITSTDFTLCDEGVTSPCDDGLEGAAHVRGCFGADPLFDELHTTASLPILQQGTAPYLDEGGDLSSPARIQRREDVCVSVTVPKLEMPEAGWPVVVYAHVSGKFGRYSNN